jgi:hypothetical protein
MTFSFPSYVDLTLQLPTTLPTLPYNNTDGAADKKPSAELTSAKPNKWRPAQNRSATFLPSQG